MAWVALVSNLTLMAVKIVVGIWGDSEAVFADGIHSAADVVASIAVLAVVGISNKPPDADHPFGHGKAEVISEAIVGIILFLVSIYIVVEAVFSFIGEPGSPRWIAVHAALGSYVAKEFLYRISLRTGKKYNSKAVMAIAYDHKADIIASLAAACGVLLSIAGKKYDVHPLLYADAAASVIVAILIFKIARKMMVSSVDVLMEKNVEQEQMERYEDLIMSFKEVKRIDRIRGRNHGHYILLDVRLAMDHNLTIKQGHDIAHQIKDKIQAHYPDVDEVFIHINPYYEENNPLG
jgi:cation diffusion facilitator family transporter